MTEKKQNQAGANQTPEEMMAQFASLWQEKWVQMLRDKGWPTEMPSPTMATMPFMNPFMMPMMGQGMGADPMMGMMMARIEELEKRIKALEKKPTAKTKTKKKD